MDDDQRRRQQTAARDAIGMVLSSCPPAGSKMSSGEYRRTMEALCSLINWGWAEDGEELAISLKESVHHGFKEEADKPNAPSPRQTADDQSSCGSVAQATSPERPQDPSEA